MGPYPRLEQSIQKHIMNAYTHSLLEENASSGSNYRSTKVWNNSKMGEEGMLMAIRNL